MTSQNNGAPPAPEEDWDPAWDDRDNFPEEIRYHHVSARDIWEYQCKRREVTKKAAGAATARALNAHNESISSPEPKRMRENIVKRARSPSPPPVLHSPDRTCKAAVWDSDLPPILTEERMTQEEFDAQTSPAPGMNRGK